MPPCLWPLPAASSVRCVFRAVVQRSTDRFTRNDGRCSASLEEITTMRIRRWERVQFGRRDIEIETWKVKVRLYVCGLFLHAQPYLVCSQIFNADLNSWLLEEFRRFRFHCCWLTLTLRMAGFLIQFRSPGSYRVFQLTEFVKEKNGSICRTIYLTRGGCCHLVTGQIKGNPTSRTHFCGEFIFFINCGEAGQCIHPGAWLLLNFKLHNGLAQTVSRFPEQ